MSDKKFFIYIIGSTHQLRQPYDTCYMYYGDNMEVEWNRCSNADSKIGRYIRMNNLSFDKNFMVIHFGSFDQCREIYKQNRPVHGLGLNDEADEEHYKKKVSNWKAPTKKPWEMTREEYKAWEKRQSGENLGKGKGFNFKGQLNPNAVIWKITDPEGNETIIEGGIRNYCNEHNISEFTLKDHLGDVIQEPNYSSDNGQCNGYIPKSEELHKRRLNTVGFKLERLTPKKFRYRKDWQRDLGIRVYKNLRP